MLQRFRVLPWALVLVVLLALFALPFPARAEWEESAAAEEEADDVELEEDGVELDEQVPRELGPHPDIQTFVHFPNNPDYKFSQGEEVVVMVGFHNGSPQHYYNVSHIGAQFHSPFDFSYYIQNFTVREMETIVGPGQEATIEYRFKPDSLLEPIEFQLSGWVIYNGTDGRVYQSTFVNQTIELLEKREPWTISGTFSSIVTLAVFVAAGYYGYQFLNETGKPVKAKKKVHRPVSTGLPVRGAGKANKNPHEAAAAAASSGSSDAAAAVSEPVHVWTADNVYTPSSKSKVVGSRKSSSKKASSKKAD